MAENARNFSGIDLRDEAFLKMVGRLENQWENRIELLFDKSVEEFEHFGVHGINLDGLEGEKFLAVERNDTQKKTPLGIFINALIELGNVGEKFFENLMKDFHGDVVRMELVGSIVDEVNL